jgi:ribosomal protein L6P/L9E
MQTESARSMKDCWFTYEALILNPPQGGTRGFNIKG